MIATGTDLGADGHLRLQPQPMAETALTPKRVFADRGIG